MLDTINIHHRGDDKSKATPGTLVTVELWDGDVSTRIRPFKTVISLA